jgi:hypothetical protein
MRKSVWIMPLLFAAIGSPIVLRADDVTFDVDATVGPGSLTGLLTVAGIGTPSGPTVVSYDLTLFDGSHSIVLTTANSQFEGFGGYHGTGLEMTPSEITFNWSTTDQFTILAPPPASPPPPAGPSSGPGGTYDGVFCLTASLQGRCANQGEAGYASIGSIDGDGPDTDLQAESGVELFATAVPEVPEPSTSSFLLIGVGLLGLMIVRKKRSGRDLPKAA